MKRIFSLVALLMVAIAITPIAEAKRFGGSKSFGKSFKTAPAPKHQRQDTRTVGQDQKAKPSSNKKGLMGGLLGGLLAVVCLLHSLLVVHLMVSNLWMS